MPIHPSSPNAPLLLFDFGGVIVDLDREQVLRSFDQLGIDIRPYLGTFKQSGIFSQLEQGRISIHDFCTALRHLSQAAHATDEAIIQAWESFLHKGVPAERLEMLLRIKRHYSINLLSNTNAIHWHMAQDRFFRYHGLEVDDFFDHVFLSCEMGIEKPAPEMFRRVIEGMGTNNPHDILFFDDSEVNCQAARQCGLQALLAPAGSEWFKYFDDYGKLHLPSVSPQP